MSADLKSPVIPIAREYSQSSLADLLDQLGGISPERVRRDPPPGTAVLSDLVAVNSTRQGPVCEWIEGTLVQKAVGQFESWLAALILGRIYCYLETNDLGMLLGAAAVLQILPDVGRAADVAFIAWSSLPGGKSVPRTDPIPRLVPDLVVEVLRASNTRSEMARKRDEFFRAGVKRIWEIDPATRTATDYLSAAQKTDVPVDGILDGGTLLPGFHLSLKWLFERADRTV